MRGNLRACGMMGKVPAAKGVFVADYPQMIVPVNHVEPAPRRIRAMLGGVTVLDTTRALYVWEWPNYPQYYVPLADVRADVLVDEHASHSVAARAGVVVRPLGRRRHAWGRGARTHRRGGAAARRHRPFRVVGARLLVRGGRGGLRPSAQSVHAGRRAALDPDGACRARRRPAGRVGLAGDGLRDRPADALLRQSHRGEPRGTLSPATP